MQKHPTWNWSLVFFLFNCLQPICSAQTPQNRLPAQISPNSRKQLWNEYWTQFKKALQNDDKGTLFKMTELSEFHWEEGILELPHEINTPMYAIPDIGAFERVYSTIFSPRFKKRILKSKPIDTKTNGFFIEWVEKGCSYSFFFSESNGAFLFSGLLIGPA